ncbi:signal peptide peptidase SppA [Aliiglaciecola sp. CAU 1673]|uniref:signal peptide peptidase SppA n=1 Tax=Aliiglaciecola sp. CAU 1673 TaxID=3032595 RepID=UPI0023DC0239|nr:signal peptide peptidase SppA [Aliiglaciecola sp. CAU 1673]MDF2180417.1 signal peptide peptidase SppA [Aliiglaciecola sp. CAU 1673]
MASAKSVTVSIFSGLWTALNFTRNLFFNIIFIIIALAILAAIFSDNGKIVVPKDSALVLNLRGDLVIEKTSVDPFEKFMQEAFDEKEENPEVLLRDVLFAIDNAKHDQRIKTLVLDLHALQRGGLDKLGQIAESLESFKESGKAVYAIGDYFSQEQYYLASHANHVYMNPMGWMILDGYGRYPLYFKSALEKLKATTHVFRVGTYKSAIEPFIRDDMSEAAREANQEWLNTLWMQYKQDVAKARNIPLTQFDEKLDAFLAKLEQANGDFAQYALDNSWVDALKTREEVRNELIELTGKDDNSRGYRHIGYEQYLSVIKSPFHLPEQGDTQQVGVVVAKGTILNGTQKAGTIGGDSTAALLRKARQDNKIKAVVLQVDSPGGSAFASEIIRQEVELLKAAGKPVVVSMSTYAASGGYWISAGADEIWAAPSTITGSIGIFGMFMTYEKTLDYLGIHADGVGTTEFSGFSPARSLDPKLGQIIQRNVEHGYEQFISLVAEKREMDKDRVDEIGQGRVWIGTKAQELGLVDKLGYLDDAIKSAAELAKLDQYDTQFVERDLSPKEQFWNEFFGKGASLFGGALRGQSDSQLMGLVKQLVSEFEAMAQLNDPKGAYAYCLPCKV